MKGLIGSYWVSIYKEANILNMRFKYGTTQFLQIFVGTIVEFLRKQNPSPGINTRKQMRVLGLSYKPLQGWSRDFPEVPAWEMSLGDQNPGAPTE